MRLSDAIRVGSALCTQSFGEYFKHDLRGTLLSACALGSALAAINQKGLVDVPCSRWEAFNDVFGHDMARRTQCPAVGCAPGGAPLHCSTVYETIIHLNDDHMWNRGRIADWVATVEAEAAQPVQAALSVAGVKAAYAAC